jgi:chemotaxis signal transduction protein
MAIRARDRPRTGVPHTEPLGAYLLGVCNFRELIDLISFFKFFGLNLNSVDIGLEKTRAK